MVKGSFFGHSDYKMLLTPPTADYKPRPEPPESARPAGRFSRCFGGRLTLLAMLAALLCGCISKSNPQHVVVRVATTTSTRDSGLLDVLLPPFKQEHHARVDVIAVGTGKALRLGEAGDCDVVLVHARPAEDAFMAAGYGSRREDVMYNTFEILGPPDDPAGVKGLAPTAALQKIAQGGYRFVSRSDDSGTHKRELQLWESGNGLTVWPEYIETGQGMGTTLIMADEMRGYVLCDRGTFLNFHAKVDLLPLVSGSPELKNPYGVMVVNSEKHPGTHSKLANELVDYFVAAKTQAMIRDYQVQGEPLFYPLHLSEEE